MKNLAIKKTDKKISDKPAPRIMLIATLAAFGGAYALYGVEPWGPPTAIVLLAAWAFFVFVIALQQDRSDRVAGRVPNVSRPKSSRLARVLHGLFLLAGLACFGYAAWLEKQGVAPDVSQPWSDGALLLLPLGMIFGWATDVVMVWVSRLRSKTSKLA